jgi:transcriptional regulator with XRE-family HTH domain
MLFMTTATGEQTTPSGWIAEADTFGARLALIRQRMKWNITEAARACDLGAESWRLWEQGRTPSRLVTIAMTIASRTGCDYLWLVHGPDRGALRDENGNLRDGLGLSYPALGERVIASIDWPADLAELAPDPTRTVRQTRPLGVIPNHTAIPAAA